MRLSKIILASSLSLLCGCAMAFAPEGEKLPNMSRVHVGASRAVVEAELGKAITDIRASPDTGATRKAYYTYQTRDPMAKDVGTYGKMVNRMVGLTGHQMYIYYSADGVVQKIVPTTYDKR